MCVAGLRDHVSWTLSVVVDGSTAFVEVEQMRMKEGPLSGHVAVLMLVLVLCVVDAAELNVWLCFPVGGATNGTGSCVADMGCANAESSRRVAVGVCQNYPVTTYDANLNRSVFWPSWSLVRNTLDSGVEMMLSLSVGCEQDGAVQTSSCLLNECCTFSRLRIAPVNINASAWAGLAVREVSSSNIGLIMGILFGIGVPLLLLGGVLYLLYYKKRHTYTPLEEDTSTHNEL